MSKPVWETKREAREAQIKELISELDKLNTNEAKVMAGALDYYGFNKGKMPHESFIAIRKELIQKATALIEREQK